MFSPAVDGLTSPGSIPGHQDENLFLGAFKTISLEALEMVNLSQLYPQACQLEYQVGLEWPYCYKTSQHPSQITEEYCRLQILVQHVNSQMQRLTSTKGVNFTPVSVRGTVDLCSYIMRIDRYSHKL